jgi:hypothetical protein
VTACFYWMIPAVLAGLVGVINAWLFLFKVPS